MNKLFFLLKLLILCIIFIFISKSVNVSEIIKILSKINLVYFFLSLLLNNISNILLTIKWYRLSIPLKIKSSFIELLQLHYISIFYSMFLPGQSSGELIKGLKLSKREGAVQKVWVPLFIDKITNLLITVIIGFAAILSDSHFRQNISLVSITFLLTLFLIFVTILLFSERTKHFTNFLKDSLIRFLKCFKLEFKFLNDFSISYFEDYKKHDLLMFETILWSLVVKIPHIFATLLLALSLNINLSLVQSTWLFSIVSIVSLLPISFSGLGVREGTVLVLLSQIGVPNSASLSLSMLIFTVGIIIGLIGGVLELFSGFKVESKSHQKT
ncbi:MAG: flippase-like domain-containing protein [Candidatus Melainabacteria bacterium]|nr:flippase-like domain-containing protein [Candidatus Melainabacteria bacterium]